MGGELPCYPGKVGGERGGQPRNFVPPSTQVASAGLLEHGMASWYVVPFRGACFALLAFSCLLNQQSNAQRIRATLSGSTLREFVCGGGSWRWFAAAVCGGGGLQRRQFVAVGGLQCQFTALWPRYQIVDLCYAGTNSEM